MRFSVPLPRILAIASLALAICGCERTDFGATDPTKADTASQIPTPRSKLMHGEWT